jgi:hypothetical protein
VHFIKFSSKLNTIGTVRYLPNSYKNVNGFEQPRSNPNIQHCIIKNKFLNSEIKKNKKCFRAFILKKLDIAKKLKINAKNFGRPSFDCLIHFYKRWRTLPPPCVSDKKLGSTARTTAEWNEA